MPRSVQGGLRNEIDFQRAPTKRINCCILTLMEAPSQSRNLLHSQYHNGKLNIDQVVKSTFEASWIVDSRWISTFAAVDPRKRDFLNRKIFAPRNPQTVASISLAQPFKVNRQGHMFGHLAKSMTCANILEFKERREIAGLGHSCGRVTCHICTAHILMIAELPRWWNWQTQGI